MGSPLFFASTARITPHLWSPLKRRPIGSAGVLLVGARSLCDVAVPWLSGWCFFFPTPLKKYANVKLEIISGGIRGENKKWLKPPPGYGVVCVKAVCFFWLFLFGHGGVQLSICLLLDACLELREMDGNTRKRKRLCLKGDPPGNGHMTHEFQCTNCTFSTTANWKHHSPLPQVTSGGITTIFNQVCLHITSRDIFRKHHLSFFTGTNITRHRSSGLRSADWFHDWFISVFAIMYCL